MAILHRYVHTIIMLHVHNTSKLHRTEIFIITSSICLPHALTDTKIYIISPSICLLHTLPTHIAAIYISKNNFFIFIRISMKKVQPIATVSALFTASVFQLYLFCRRYKLFTEISSIFSSSPTHMSFLFCRSPYGSPNSE